MSSLIKEYGTAQGMGADHYGGWDTDNDYACVSCMHMIENPSDIFGSWISCAVEEDGCDCMYCADEDEERCPSWVQSTKCHMTKLEYDEQVSKIANKKRIQMTKDTDFTKGWTISTKSKQQISQNLSIGELEVQVNISRQYVIERMAEELKQIPGLSISEEDYYKVAEAIYDDKEVQAKEVNGMKVITIKDKPGDLQCNGKTSTETLFLKNK